jgi:hypothetical protein
MWDASSHKSTHTFLVVTFLEVIGSRNAKTSHKGEVYSSFRLSFDLMVPLQAGFATLRSRLAGRHRASSLRPLSMFIQASIIGNYALDVKSYFE